MRELAFPTARALLAEHGLLTRVVNPGADHFTQVAYDSKKVAKGALFFCKGDHFKEVYLNEAVSRGAKAYVAERECPEQVTGLIVTNVQKAMALLANAFYDFPGNELFTIGITGTKGKTTTAYFCQAALKEATGNHTALLSTLNTYLGPGVRFKSKLTTPESLDLFGYMRQAVDAGMTHLVMEVSSQSYLRDRVYSLHFDVGIFLNISPDHIGENEHPTFANYLFCKEQLMQNATTCVIDANTDSFAQVYQTAKAAVAPEQIYLFARAGSPVDAPLDLTYQSRVTDLAGSSFRLTATSAKGQALGIAGAYRASIPGDYNVANATAATIAALLAGSSQENVQQAIKNLHVAGRMELLKTNSHGVVYVDYAHDYASVKRLIAFLKHQEGEQRRVTVVLGATGNKGISRRAGFGKALSEEGADLVILTTDDPGYEDPKKIAAEIDSHIDHTRVGTVRYVADRATAIREAIEDAGPADLVVIAGKGSDHYQKVKGQDLPYPGDITVARRVIDQLANSLPSD